eukprot:163969-Prymnesium_polylepis.2
MPRQRAAASTKSAAASKSKTARSPAGLRPTAVRSASAAARHWCCGAVRLASAPRQMLAEASSSGQLAS